MLTLFQVVQCRGEEDGSAILLELEGPLGAKEGQEGAIMMMMMIMMMIMIMLLMLMMVAMLIIMMMLMPIRTTNGFQKMRRTCKVRYSNLYTKTFSAHPRGGRAGASKVL